jgi:hypothetical protein
MSARTPAKTRTKAVADESTTANKPRARRAPKKTPGKTEEPSDS